LTSEVKWSEILLDYLVLFMMIGFFLLFSLEILTSFELIVCVILALTYNRLSDIVYAIKERE
jgi:hypothetical protein